MHLRTELLSFIGLNLIEHETFFMIILILKNEIINTHILQLINVF